MRPRSRISRGGSSTPPNTVHHDRRRRPLSTSEHLLFLSSTSSHKLAIVYTPSTLLTQYFCTRSRDTAIMESYLEPPSPKKLKTTRIEILMDGPDPSLSSFTWSDFPILSEELNIPPTVRGMKQSSSMPTLVSSSEEEDLEEALPCLTDENMLSQPRIRFSKRIQIREYETILGDHPWSDSYPLTFGWNYRQTYRTETPTSRPETTETATFRKPKRLSQEEKIKRLTESMCISESDLKQIEQQRSKEAVMSIARARYNIPNDDRQFIGSCLILHSKTSFDLEELANLNL